MKSQLLRCRQLTFFVALLHMACLACGKQPATSSQLQGRAKDDPALAALRTTFETATPLDTTEKSYAALKLGRDRNCAMMSAVDDQLSTSFLTQKFIKFAGLIKSEMTFDQNMQVQTMTYNSKFGLATQMTAVPMFSIAKTAEVNFRVTAEGRIAEEWTIDASEFLGYTTKSGTGTLVLAETILDHAVANKARLALLYAVCE